MTSELRAELRGLVSGRVGIADGVIPPILFVLIDGLQGTGPAAVAGIGSALGITGWRLARGRQTRFAVAGLFGTAVAAALALRSGDAGDYFLPGILSGAATTTLLLISLVLGRPGLAFMSWLTRGWPIAWYWHPRVRPAYTRTTVLWTVFFASRTAVQFWLFRTGEIGWLAAARVGLGWPALLLLLVVTYTLGRRWLGALNGPSVEEFESGSPPPWVGQATGF